MQSNPFLDSSFLPRWSEMAPELIGPGIDTALERAEAAIAAIETETGAPTFENTFLALDLSTDALNKAWSRVNHLSTVLDSPPLREAYNAALPKVSAFSARIPLRPALWARLKAFADLPAASKLSADRARYVSETIAEFREAGADLPPEGKARLEAIQTELSKQTQKFSENVLDSTNAWQLVVTDESRLAGLPPQAKARALADATAKGLATEGKPAWRFTLQQPSLEPFMTYLEDAALREEMWRAAASLGAVSPHDNTALILSILKLRTEKANILGKAHFADLILARRMAKTGDTALAFIEGLRKGCASAFRRECDDLEAFKAKETGNAKAHPAPWELMFLTERLRKAEYAFDEEQLRPYFPMEGVMTGLFEICRRVFGIRVVEKTGDEAKAWSPDVKYFDMFNRDNRHVGSFYSDWYPRDSKRGGAWMGGLVTGGPEADGSRSPHMGYICGNMTPPSPGKPALLSHREVETVFHEFGHLIHHLLSDVEIRSLAGTNVAWDFVELPSQIMENWCWERESLDLFARHFETGAAIPQELFLKMTAAKNFRSAVMMTRQAAQAEMDLLLHMHPSDFVGASDVEPALRAAISACLIPTEPPAPTIIKRFSHLFSDPVGYAAGYYSYKWAEVLDADAFTRFRKEGLFSERVGREFVERILSKGNSADAGQLFRNFMGRDPDLNALLERSGLAT